jgi:hypothetical protein
MPRSIGHKLFAVSAAIALTASISLPQAIADSNSTPQNNTSEQEEPREPRLSMSDGSPLGIGTLRPKDGKESIGQWLNKTQIVLFDRPQGKEIGKLDQGLLKRNGQPDQILTVAPLDAYYAANVFPVFAKQKNEWFHIRYQIGQGNNGTAWIKASQFQKGGMPLDYVSWQEYIMDVQSPIEPIGESQYIYQNPTTRSKSLTTLKAGYVIQPLQIQGDWLKVKYSFNVQACDGEEEATKKTRIFTGWTRWRKDGKSLIRIPEKGC